MLLPRIIPCLLIHKGGLVKTIKFENPKYLGDPINAVKIFNEKEVDELIVLDIDASVNNSEPNYVVISKLASECTMPFCYGGGIKTKEQAKKIISLGVEKIAISSAAIYDTSIITEISKELGRQSVVVSLDIRKTRSLSGDRYEICSHNASQVHNLDLMSFIKLVEEAGAGEILINSIDCDGLMSGYDISLAKQVKNFLSIPVTFLGGAGSIEHIQSLIQECGIIGAAAGSLFVFKGKYKAVLINYPEIGRKIKIFDSMVV
jgi:cyclase